MRLLTNLSICTTIVLASSFVVAQEFPSVEPTPEHVWLKKFEGKWKTEASAIEDGKEGPVMTGSIDSKMLGELWLVNSMAASFGDIEMQGRQTIGYDQEK